MPEKSVKLSQQAGIRAEISIQHYGPILSGLASVPEKLVVYARVDDLFDSAGMFNISASIFISCAVACSFHNTTN